MEEWLEWLRRHVLPVSSASPREVRERIARQLRGECPAAPPEEWEVFVDEEEGGRA